VLADDNCPAFPGLGYPTFEQVRSVLHPAQIGEIVFGDPAGVDVLAEAVFIQGHAPDQLVTIGPSAANFRTASASLVISVSGTVKPAAVAWASCTGL
jgi:hypothetical protein